MQFAQPLGDASGPNSLAQRQGIMSNLARTFYLAIKQVALGEA